jgi:hypothetical protein
MDLVELYYPEHRRWRHRPKWIKRVDSSEEDLFPYMSEICHFIDRMASPPLAPLTT